MKKISRHTGRGVIWLLAALPAFADGEERASTILESGLAPADVVKKPYTAYARACIDLLIEHGTDRYGKIHRPILMNILDVRTRSCPQDPLPLDEPFRVTRRERRGPAGANLYLDQSTLRAMLRLSKITGDERYAAFARRCLSHYLDHLVDEKGMFWWGWHRHYDAYRDVMTGHQGNHHEIHVNRIIWPELWDVNAQAVRREIEGIWKWHIIDKTTGECNRHDDGLRGCDFAMSGGEMLYAFAFLYTKTEDRKWLDRAERVADYYWGKRHAKTNLIPNRPNAEVTRFDGSHFETSIAGLYARSLLGAHALTGEPRFRDQAVAYLEAYARYGYDADEGRFWGSLRLDGTPVPGPRVVGGYAQYEPRGHIDMWGPYVLGYEYPIHAAQSYAYAYELTKNDELLRAAKRWAACIRRALPATQCDKETWYGPYAETFAPHGTYAGVYGRTISFFLHLEQLTGEASYRDTARQVAAEALANLYYKGMIRGHGAKPYYESVDGVGYLLLALLQLDHPDRGSLHNW